MKTLEESFNYLENKKTFSLNKLLYEFKDFGLAIIGLILALPSALPIPATYYSTPIGIILFFIGFSFLIKKNIFPKKYLNKKIKVSRIKNIHKRIFPLIKFIDKISKKRFIFFFNNYFVGLSIIILSIVMIIPYPLTDTLPAFALLWIFFSIINEDGVFYVIGCFFGILSIIIAYLAINYGYILIKEIIINMF